jgi:hypothetical protein
MKTIVILLVVMMLGAVGVQAEGPPGVELPGDGPGSECLQLVGRMCYVDDPLPEPTGRMCIAMPTGWYCDPVDLGPEWCADPWSPCIEAIPTWPMIDGESVGDYGPPGYEPDPDEDRLVTEYEQPVYMAPWGQVVRDADGYEVVLRPGTYIIRGRVPGWVEIWTGVAVWVPGG